MKKTKLAIRSRLPMPRMLKIHEKLQAGTYPNCVQMAKEMEAGVRTLKRDIEYMRDQMNMPIEYDELRHGFYYSKPVKHFPNVAATEAELFALLVAHKAIAQYHGTPFQRPLQMAFEKLSGQLDRTERYSLQNLQEGLSFRPLAPGDTDVKLFQTLTQALQRKRVLRFRYKNLGAKQAQERRVRPYHLACIENHWYLFGWDLQREAIRTFSLSRLTSPEMTKEEFKAPKDFDPDEYLRGSFSVFKGKADYEVVILFDTWGTDLVRGRQWHASQTLEELPEGGSRLKMRLSSLEEIERWILGWGMHATVLGPPELVARMVETTEKLAQKYAKVKLVSL